jgi:hypothetical protein
MNELQQEFKRIKKNKQRRDRRKWLKLNDPELYEEQKKNRNEKRRLKRYNKN